MIQAQFKDLKPGMTVAYQLMGGREDQMDKRDNFDSMISGKTCVIYSKHKHHVVLSRPSGVKLSISRNAMHCNSSKIFVVDSNNKQQYNEGTLVKEVRE
jgi:hypothetical protein